MTEPNHRSLWKTVAYGAVVVVAWFVYAWLGVRLIHTYHGGLAAEWGLEAALACEVAAAALGGIMLAALLRGSLGTWQRAASVALWMALIVIGHHIAFMENMSAREFLSRAGMGDDLGSLAMISAVYLVLLAIPFVPGIEVGLLIIALYGPWGAVAVFAATNLGLQIGFLAGCLCRALPVLPAKLTRLLVDQSAPAGAPAAETSENGLMNRLGRLWPRISGYRYLLLGLLLNLPGNAVVGGGGGIAFLSGFSRRFSWLWYTLTILIATCPVPILAALGVLSAEALR